MSTLTSDNLVPSKIVPKLPNLMCFKCVTYTVLNDRKGLVMVHYYMPLLCLFASIGRVVWSREEALTRISALDFVGLPSAHYGTQAFPVLLDKEQPSSMLAMFVQRFYGQLLQIQVSTEFNRKLFF